MATPATGGVMSVRPTRDISFRDCLRAATHRRMAAAAAAATAAAALQQRQQLQQQMQRHQPQAVRTSLMNHFTTETLAPIFEYGHNPYSDASWVQLFAFCYVSRKFSEACKHYQDYELDIMFHP